MKKIKIILTVCLLCAMLLNISACSAGKPVVTPSDSPEPAVTPETIATPEPVVEPTTEPTIEPSKEPVAETTPEPTVEPTEEPVYTLATLPQSKAIEITKQPTDEELYTGHTAAFVTKIEVPESAVSVGVLFLAPDMDENTPVDELLNEEAFLAKFDANIVVDAKPDSILVQIVPTLLDMNGWGVVTVLVDKNGAWKTTDIARLYVKTEPAPQTQTPTQTPVSTPKPTEAPKPQPTPTPKPVETPKPTNPPATPKPTETPKPVETPKPTTPPATPTPKPTETPTGCQHQWTTVYGQLYTGKTVWRCNVCYADITNIVNNSAALEAHWAICIPKWQETHDGYPLAGWHNDTALIPDGCAKTVYCTLCNEIKSDEIIATTCP